MPASEEFFAKISGKSTIENGQDKKADENFFNRIKNLEAMPLPRKETITDRLAPVVQKFKNLEISGAEYKQAYAQELMAEHGKDNVRPILNKSGGIEDVSVYNPVGDKFEQQGLGNKLREAKIERQNELIKTADKEGGATFLRRLGATFKANKRGQFSFLQNRYGEKNVVPIYGDGDDVNNFLVRNEGQKDFTLFNPEGMDVGDLADVAKLGVEIAPGLAGSIAGASRGRKGETIGGAVGDLASGVALQAADAILPGESGLTPSERAAEVGIGVGAGLAGEGAISGTGALLRKNPFSPFFRDSRFKERVSKDIIFEGRDPKLFTENIAEGQRLEREIPGLQFDAPQLVASETGLGARRALEQTPGVGGEIADIRTRQIDVLSKNFEKTLENVALGSVNAARAGELVGDAIKNTRKAIISKRSSEARPLFEKVDTVANGQPVIWLDNTLRAIDEIAEDIQGNFTTGTTSKVLTQLQKMRESLTTGQTNEIRNLAQISSQQAPGTTGLGEFKSTAKRFSRDMSNLSRVIYGQGRLVDDVPMSQDQYLSRKLLNAMEDDLGDTISSGGIGKEAASALNQARSSWAQNSAQLERLRTDSLDKIYKQYEAGDAEKMASKIVKGLSNKNIRKTMSQIEKIDPDAAAQMRAAALSEMFKKSFRGGDFKPGMFRNIAKDKDSAEKIHSIFWGDTSGAAAIRKIANIASASERITRGGILTKGGSQTAPMQGIVKMLQKINIPVLSGGGEIITGIGSKMSKTENFARALTDPTMRKDFMMLVDPPKWAKTAVITRSATRLLNALNEDTEIQE